MSNKRTIYCLSGLGADEKIFAKLTIDGFNLKYLPWLKPTKDEELESYSIRMAGQIDSNTLPIILGVSFGGMIGVEIALKMPVHRLILISSIKTSFVLPPWLRFAGKWKMHKMLPTKSYKLTEWYDNRQLGVCSEEEKQLVRYYRNTADRVFLEWAIHEILNWKNQQVPENLFHIHGESDKVFPVKYIKPTHSIKNGSHIMIMNKAEEISVCINDILEHDSTFELIQ